MAFLQIYACPGVNAWNQLTIEVNPQLVPRSLQDLGDGHDNHKAGLARRDHFERITKTECAVVSLSGVAINSTGMGTSYFALIPGHAYPHYGSIDVQDRLLVSGQPMPTSWPGCTEAGATTHTRRSRFTLKQISA